MREKWIECGVGAKVRRVEVDGHGDLHSRIYTPKVKYDIILPLSGIDAPGWGYKAKAVRTGPAAMEIRRNPHGPGSEVIR